MAQVRWKRVAILLTVLLTASLLLATAQMGDVLLVDGQQYSMQTEPLEPFLTNNRDRLPVSNVASTANWRGYIATWEIKEDRLLLTDIAIQMEKPGAQHLETEYRSVLSAVFPDQSHIIADWFTGHLIVPAGKLKDYVHSGYASTFEKYLVITVRNGVVTGRWQLGYPAFVKFRDLQFLAYKKTVEYQAALARATSGEEPMSPQRAEEFLRRTHAEEYMSRIFEESK